MSSSPIEIKEQLKKYDGMLPAQSPYVSQCSNNNGSNLVNGAFVQCAASGGQILLEIFEQICLEYLDKYMCRIFRTNIWTYSLVRLVWQNMEELIFRPFTGPIRLLLQDCLTSRYLKF